jgi:hypothetical protein
MRLRPDRFELGLLVLVGALSLWIVGCDVLIAHGRSLVWTRTDGFFPVDQLQYLAWIQSSARHGLISDLFVLRPTPADYLQPAIMLSGLFVRLGMASWLALMLWKPVAVVAIVLAARALTSRCFDAMFDRRAALVLALLYASLSDVNHSLGVIGDMMTMWQSWGYPFGLLAAALITWGLLSYARVRDAGRVSWAPAVAEQREHEQGRSGDDRRRGRERVARAGLPRPPHRVEVAEAEVVDERDRDQRDRQQRERDHGVTCRMA